VRIGLQGSVVSFCIKRAAGNRLVRRDGSHAADTNPGTAGAAGALWMPFTKEQRLTARYLL
jgi:hypothetical protein